MIARESAPGILLLGSDSGFCFQVLKTLRDLGLAVAEVFLVAGSVSNRGHPVMSGAIPLSQPGSVVDLAAREGISVVQCQSTREDWAFELARALAPELLLVACLPERLGARWFSVPKLGCFNLHPSLLPAYRGPAPLFWQLRDGLPRTGVTIHRVEAAIDAGAVLAREAIRIGGDDTLANLNAALATAGARLFARSLDKLLSGNAALTAQDESAATYHPWPKQADFSLDTAWPASRAFRFVRATAGLGRPYRMETQAGPLLIDRVIGFDDAALLADPFERRQGGLRIRFSPGVLQAVGKADA